MYWSYSKKSNYKDCTEHHKLILTEETEHEGWWGGGVGGGGISVTDMYS